MDDLHWLGATLAADALAALGLAGGVLDGRAHPLAPGRSVRGRASTVELATDDNLFMRNAIERGPVDGPVLVVGGGARSRAALMGGLLGLELARAGFRAVVTDGLVRDSRELLELELPIWARGVTPSAPLKRGPGRVASPITVAGVEVAPGDFVVADDDGVVVWPGDRYQELLAAARARDASDRERQARILRG